MEVFRSCPVDPNRGAFLLYSHVFLSKTDTGYGSDFEFDKVGDRSQVELSIEIAEEASSESQTALVFRQVLQMWTSFLDCCYPSAVLHRGFSTSGEDCRGHTEEQSEETYLPKELFVPKFTLNIGGKGLFVTLY